MSNLPRPSTTAAARRVRRMSAQQLPCCGAFARRGRCAAVRSRARVACVNGVGLAL